MKASVLFHKIDLFKRAMERPFPFSTFSELEFQNNFLKLTNEYSLGSSDWLNAIFQSKYSKRLLFRTSKSGFNSLVFISEMHSDFLSMIYRDLVDESRIISQRIDRFVYHLEEVWEDLRKTGNDKLQRSHGIDLSLISLLLSVSDPTHYLYFDRVLFQDYMRVMERPINQQYDDYERYCKVMRNTFKQMNNRIDIEKVKDLQIKKSVHYSDDSIAWAGIFANYAVGNLD